MGDERRTPRGTALVDQAARLLLVEIFDATKDFTNHQTGRTNLTHHRDVARVLDDCRVPVTRLDRPLLLAAAGNDEIVPSTVIHDFAADITAAGSTVHLTTYPDATHSTIHRGRHRRDDVGSRPHRPPAPPAPPSPKPSTRWRPPCCP
ncbi:hypothetical protein GCM10010492_54840 [Saccharothrix mutabilis subsp. mutabilis]|uniref:Dienelactone hydrolase domain-containing protein n=1 Tax=Saccharothrix mutabilis subsp. mutabilis TaxID=66855 RepID=A0ABP3DZN5_9PSEU